MLGLSTEELRSIPSASGKLMPEDVERYVANREAGEEVEAESEKVSSFTKHPLSEQQKILNFRLRQSARLVIPCTCGRPVEWSLVHQAAEQFHLWTGKEAPLEAMAEAFDAAGGAQATSD